MISDLLIGHFTPKRIAKRALLKRFKYRFLAVSMTPICPNKPGRGRILGVGSIFFTLPTPKSGGKARGRKPLKEKSRPFAPTGPSRWVAPVKGGTLGGCPLHVKEDVKGGKKEDKSHNTQGNCGDLFGFLT
jgi:hypothetical protein